LHNFFNLYRILNKENIFKGFENEKLYRKIFSLFIGYKTKNIKKDLQLQLRKILMEERNLFFLY